MSTTPPPTNDMNVYILQPTGMFRNAPFCKFWFITTIICSIIKMYMNLQTSQRNTTVLAEIDAYSVLHMIFSTFTAVSIPELTVTSLCIYFLRNIERRFGTRRFMNVLFISLLLSHGIHISILKFLFIHYDPGKIFFYYSPLTAIFIAYFNYILEVPVFATSMIFDLLPASDHHFILILLS
uniref:Uncharacterized protein n=1 Tax=Panagrolaimus sp. JU765 TaxID=591449 RepID=A0AC34RHA9_9BILA